MVMIYEAQFLAAEAAHRTTGDMVLTYPSPTVLSKHTLVPLNSNGDQVGRLLSTDPELQQLAVKYGFRTADAASVSRYLADRFGSSELDLPRRPEGSASPPPRPHRPIPARLPARLPAQSGTG